MRKLPRGITVSGTISTATETNPEVLNAKDN